ncbi:hypothetical protein [Chondromyces crocatus]|uniref:Uncharacterized protein n=1 Tax=Chondromyces crocatus TaxID=52 RepID=A0A0K1EG71_CHOCO|nr:hypothetical protein [Chondromyces crocatus]AKT39875.1 uncharacterized protein CMC5_040260 [Chondromyces crocatus]
MNRRRIWSELLPLAEVGSPPVLRLLARYGLDLAIAVRPDTLPELPALCRAAASAGVPVAVWPMLDDAAGRWASGATITPYRAFIEELLATLTREDLTPAEIIVDLEPPIGHVQRALDDPRGLWSLLRSRAGDDGTSAVAAFRALVETLDARGIVASAAIVPFLLRDGSWERTLGTPVTGVGFRGIHAMLYTSMIEGWSRGLLRRADVLALLALLCRAARLRFGDAVGASLGVVGVGALGDEPTYRDPEELRQDAAIARAAGIDDLALFDLAGVLSRPPPEAWLDAFVDASPHATPAPTLRAHGALAALDCLQLLSRLRPFSRTR